MDELERVDPEAQDRAHRRRRLRRQGRRAYIRSVYFLPSLATLGNAICGFGAIYIAGFGSPTTVGSDPFAIWLAHHKFFAAAYLIFLAMVFDALDGRLARFARHTTDFGGQLDSLADVISFGAAPAFIALQVIKADGYDAPFWVTRLIWATGALYLACTALRLARFNVSNEHGEQHHFSFLGLPSPGAGGAICAWVLMQQDLRAESASGVPLAGALSSACVAVLPLVVLACGLLMVSNFRYPHVVNRYLRGRRSLGRLLAVVALALLVVVAHRYALAMILLGYAAWGPLGWVHARWKSRPPSGGPAAP
jgi:CDP-diacylglycerol--serine O-phosphatidyltransferase